MPAIEFDARTLASWYAREHLKTDPGVDSVYYLPTGAGPREIRLIEVNQLINTRLEEIAEPIDFGIDSGMESAHTLFILDVSPEQWRQIEQANLRLPQGWSLAGALCFSHE